MACHKSQDLMPDLIKSIPSHNFKLYVVGM